MHNIPGKNQRIWRGLLLVPWVIPLALSTLTWWWMFDPSYSAFNWILNEFGFANVPWLGVGWIARFCTITVNVWFGTPFFMIMYLAALKSVPEQLYEAASIDGAGAVQKLFFVTLPMMRNIIAITVLFSLIVTFADFDIVRILTAGGPQDMTHVFATYAFQVGIQSGDIPLGAADSLFMFPILAVRRVLRAARRDPAHQGDRGMSATTAVAARRSRTSSARAHSLHRQRQWALWGSYIALGRVRGDVPGAAVLHADDQPEVLGGDLGADRQPVDRAPPDAGEFLVPDHLSELPDLLPELGDRSRSLTVAIAW